MLEHTPVGNPKTYAIVDTQRGLHEESQKRTVEYQSSDLGKLQKPEYKVHANFNYTVS